jgi:hypothetical protein
MWTYRIVQTSHENETMMDICEVYYDEEKRPAMYCPAEVGGEDLEELKEVYEWIGDAFKAPVLRYPEDFTGSIDRG